jgi:hypothetical protein
VEAARHTRRELEKAAADIEHRDRMRALALKETEAMRACAAQCELRDEYGWVLDEEAGYEVECDHRKAEDSDDL